MIYLFDHTEKLVAELKAGEIQEALQEETLDGQTKLSLTIPIAAKEKLRGVEFLAHKGQTEPEKIYMYRLISAKNDETTITYTAINIAFDDLRGYGYIREKRPEKVTARGALEVVLSGSRWSVAIADETPTASLFFYDNTRLEAIGKIMETYGVDLDFRVQITGNKITGRLVDLYAKRGRDTGKRFFYGANALTVVREMEQSDLYTAVIGRGKGEEKFDTSGQATGGYGRKINFKEVEWQTAKGDPVDKPKGQEYVELKEATARYGYSDGTPRFKIITHQDTEDPVLLLQQCYEDVVAGSRPLVHFQAIVQNVGRLDLGDTVRIIRKDLDIWYQARVFKVKRDLLDPRLTQVEFGDDLSYSQGRLNKTFSSAITSLDIRLDAITESAQTTFNDLVTSLQEGLAQSYYNDDGYNYELKKGNKYGLPAGYYSFNAPIENKPTKVIYMGAGKMAIANKRDASGDWLWQTFGTGDGLVAETIVGKLGALATVQSSQINVDSDFAATQLGRKVVIQDKLYNNVKITPAKGLQVLDNESRERIQLGNWSPGRYGMKLTDASGQRTVLDDQGIIQSWQDGRCDNTDSGHPLRLHVYLPRETAKIYKAELRISIDKFRAFSKSLSTQSSTYTATDSGGGSQETTSAGGGTYQSTSYAESVSETTHGANVNGGNIWRAVYDSQGESGKLIGYALDYHVYSHEHDLRIPGHDHQVSIDAHTHSISLPSHTHDFTIPGHSHDIVYGIYEEMNHDSNLELYINGKDCTSAVTGSGYFSGSVNGGDIKPYLELNKWNTIEIRSRLRMRIDATVFIQALLNYGG